MTIDIRIPALTCGKALARWMLGLFAASATLGAVAAPSSPVAPQPDQAAGTAYSYLWIIGSTFHPVETATTYSYPGGGCISKTGGSSPLFTHKAVLPEGAVVRYLRLYFYDNSTSSIWAAVTTYDGLGNYSYNGSTIYSTDDFPGSYASILSPLLSYPVNQYASAISVTANLGEQNDSNLRFCGVRIAYDEPISDRIFANGFDL